MTYNLEDNSIKNVSDKSIIEGGVLPEIFDFACHHVNKQSLHLNILKLKEHYSIVYSLVVRNIVVIIVSISCDQKYHIFLRTSKHCYN